MNRTRTVANKISLAVFVVVLVAVAVGCWSRRPDEPRSSPPQCSVADVTPEGELALCTPTTSLGPQESVWTSPSGCDVFSYSCCYDLVAKHKDDGDRVEEAELSVQLCSLQYGEPGGRDAAYQIFFGSYVVPKVRELATKAGYSTADLDELGAVGGVMPVYIRSANCHTHSMGNNPASCMRYPAGN